MIPFFEFLLKAINLFNYFIFSRSLEAPLRFKLKHFYHFFHTTLQQLVGWIILTQIISVKSNCSIAKHELEFSINSWTICQYWITRSLLYCTVEYRNILFRTFIPGNSLYLFIISVLLELILGIANWKFWWIKSVWSDSSKCSFIEHHNWIYLP